MNHSIYSDTNPKIEAKLIQMLRDVPSWRKFEMVAELNKTVFQLAEAGVRERNPQATDKEIFRKLADIILGAELALKVYGPHQQINEL